MADQTVAPGVGAWWHARGNKRQRSVSDRFGESAISSISICNRAEIAAVGCRQLPWRWLREFLIALQEYIQDRLVYLRTEPAPEELADEDEQIVEVQYNPEYERPEDVPGKATAVLKKIPCGSGCDGCSHGPYVY
ncbi:MAG: hypothetical protein ABEH65_00390 [Halobacteriales archaeon]